MNVPRSQAMCGSAPAWETGAANAIGQATSPLHTRNRYSRSCKVACLQAVDLHPMLCRSGGIRMGGTTVPGYHVGVVLCSFYRHVLDDIRDREIRLADQYDMTSERVPLVFT